MSGRAPEDTIQRDYEGIPLDENVALLEEAVCRSWASNHPRKAALRALSVLVSQRDEARREYAKSALLADVETRGKANYVAKWQDAEARVEVLEAALALVDSPYPESVFTPLSREECDILYAAMRATSVPYPTERLYSQYARERGEAARSILDDVLAPPKV